MVVTKSDLYPNDTMGMENKTVVVTTILVKHICSDLVSYNIRCESAGQVDYTFFISYLPQKQKENSSAVVDI